ncbi:hypothetical protein M8J77_000648 [Diaphorina citri]|nr:hypothetical protein M8J77_000648 [Diaphorina citri]
MQPADAAVSRRMNISWYAAKWRRHALTQISLRQIEGNLRLKLLNAQAGRGQVQMRALKFPNFHHVGVTNLANT